MSLADSLSAFFAERDLPLPHQKTERGGYAFALDGKFIVELWEDGDDVIGLTWLGGVPRDPAERQDLIGRLMRYQLARIGQDDLVLGLDDAEDSLHLHARWPATEVATLGVDGVIQRLVDGANRYRIAMGNQAEVAARPAAPMIIRP